MTERCRSCGEARLVAVLLPGHVEVEAVVCLECGAVQPVVVRADGPEAGQNS